MEAGRGEREDCSFSTEEMTEVSVLVREKNLPSGLQNVLTEKSNTGEGL